MSIDDPKTTAKKPDTITEVNLARDPRAQRDADTPPLNRAERAARPAPALALRSDGATLLSLTYLEGADLTGRECWSDVALTEKEADDIRRRVSGACDDAAANVAATILRKLGASEDDENSGGGRSE